MIDDLVGFRGTHNCEGWLAAIEDLPAASAMVPDAFLLPQNTCIVSAAVKSTCKRLNCVKRLLGLDYHVQVCIQSERAKGEVVVLAGAIKSVVTVSRITLHAGTCMFDL